MGRSIWILETIAVHADAAPSRHGRAGVLAIAAVGLAVAMSILSCRGPARAAPLMPGGEALQCDGIRRLADNYLLDLQVRFVFEPGGRYRRFEDAGRGWEEVAAGGQWQQGPGDRVILQNSPYVTAYLERLSGTYYYIDRSGVTLSVWGHCGVSTPPRARF